ncbi:MAG: hypothetical protein AAGI66_04135 [Cyanobacteria bacterium P01_H01_bin.74]
MTIAEVGIDDAKLYQFVLIDKISKFAYIELCFQKIVIVTKDLPLYVIEVVPYKIQTLICFNDSQLTQ